MAKLISYDLDGIERDVREAVKDWGGPPITITRMPDRLDVTQPGLIPRDGTNYLELHANGNGHIYWSFPRGMLIEDIITKHRISDAAPVATTDGEQG